MTGEQGHKDRFGPQYCEEFDAPDGTRMRLRRIRPDDKAQLVSGFSDLSPESRYRRFFTAKETLSEAELRYLTEVDGYDHFALALGEIDGDGQEIGGVGIGRFVRLADEPEVAEPALAVIDARHGQGLGRRLMLRLVAAATQRGIRAFRAEFLADNAAIRDLLTDVVDEVEFSADGAVVTATMHLPNFDADHPADEPAPTSSVARWLKMAAARVVQLRHKAEQRWGG